MDTTPEAPTDLRSALASMRASRDSLLGVTATLSPDDLARRRPGGWSVARVLAHVIESEWIYVKLMAHMVGREAPASPAEAEASAEPESSAEATGRLNVVRAAFESALEGVDESRLYTLVHFGHEEFSPLSLVENIAMHDGEHHNQIIALLAPRARATSQPPRNAAVGVVVRPAGAIDLPRLTEIYNHYIINTATTFDLVPFTVEQRRAWFSHYATSGRHRLLVAERDGVVLGYASTSQFRPKQAYETTVEMTVICAPEAVGQGIGQRLYEVIFDAIAGEDIHAAVAAITLPNDASCELHKRFGFSRAATLPQVGRKFGQYWDVAWYVRLFD
jgi:phosphinothricin acetyltransferase